jgi:hypothetical protein
MNELETVLGCEDPPASINNLLVERVDDLAVAVDEPGDVEWINGVMAGELETEVRALQAREGDDE